jgi:hypothetical protein
MATVTGLTADRMIEMENATIIAGNVVGGDLILVTKDGTNINAGSVIGPIGPAGASFIVCTSTTRPSLTAGEAGKAIYETDTKLIRLWIGTRWRLQEKIICSSTTRPAMTVDDEGVKIYETDSDAEFVWTGSSWLPINIGAPAGACFPWLGTVAPMNHVLMYGQTIVNAQTLYPSLWINSDPVWKSGSNLIIPDLRGRIPIGKDDMGGSRANRITDGYAKFNGAVMGAVGGHQSYQTHTHSGANHLHAPGPFGLQALSPSGPSIIGLAGGGDFSPGIIQTTEYAANSPGGVGATGANGDGNSGNVQPSIILNWILKIL